jgi:hypothetical protein
MPYSGSPHSETELDLSSSPPYPDSDIQDSARHAYQSLSSLRHEIPLDSAGSSGGKSWRSDYFGQYLTKGPHKKSIPESSWVSTPVNGTEEKWIEKEQEAVEWLSLFYGRLIFTKPCGM